MRGVLCGRLGLTDEQAAAAIGDGWALYTAEHHRERLRIRALRRGGGK